MSWKATLARAVFSSRARRALEEARRDLDARTLPEAVAARVRIPIGPRVRSKTMRGVAAALAGLLERAGETHPCLVSSLALLGEARRCGYAPSLVLGVRKGESGAASHAWLALDGEPFLEAAHVAASYETIAVLPDPTP
ncbi:MAG TPA: lasso peptide biosynthesis B2 protein [Planctomycetota bacterium]|nr:lasso peptide biosynthesis B2 protein [Planctomycetota bacterium]